MNFYDIPMDIIRLFILAVPDAKTYASILLTHSVFCEAQTDTDKKFIKMKFQKEVNEIVGHGSKRTEIKYFLVDGKRHGDYTKYFIRILLSQSIDNHFLLCHRTYKNGFFEGEHIVHDKNGFIREYGFFTKNKKQGKWKKWRADGTLEEKRVYRNGQLDGIVKEINPEGVVTRKIFYENGQTKRIVKFVKFAK